MMRRALSLLVVAVLVAACSGAAPEPVDTTPDSAATSSVASPTAVPSASTATAQPVPTSGPSLAVGESRRFATAVTNTRMVPFDPAARAEGDEWAWQLLYHVDRDELWAVVGDDGTPYWLALSADADLGIGTAFDDLRRRGADTVLVDLKTGGLTQVFPFPVEIHPWSTAGHPVVRIPPAAASDPRTADWTAGTYELDLDQGIATLVSTADPFRGWVAVPADSALGAGVLEWRTFPDQGISSLVFSPEVGPPEQIMSRLAGSVSWAPSGRFLTLQRRDGEWSIYDIYRDSMFDLTAGASGAGNWSPDGRFFVFGRAGSTGIVDTAGLLSGAGAESLRVIGPFADAIFADWGPGASPTEALLLGEYCAPDGFRLDRVDLATGERSRIPTTVGGFWVYDWSPRGDLIAVSSWDVDGGFTLIDAVTGGRAVRPTLDTVVTTMRDVAWSASGEWIKLNEIGGRDRCAV